MIAWDFIRGTEFGCKCRFSVPRLLESREGGCQVFWNIFTFMSRDPRKPESLLDETIQAWEEGFFFFFFKEQNQNQIELNRDEYSFWNFELLLCQEFQDFPS